MDVFGPIKEINKLLKEINRLLNKGMLNIYFKITRRLAAKLCGFFLLFSFRTELRHFRV